MTIFDYYDRPEISQSMLKDLKKSPYYFWAKHINPNKEIEAPTPAMEFGKALHMSVLEPDLFAETYTVDPKIDKRSNEGKALHAEWLKNNEGKIRLKEEDAIKINVMTDRVLKNLIVKDLFKNSFFEHEIYWTDQTTLTKCKGKLDAYLPPGKKFPNGLIMDLKTTANASMDEFSRTIWNYGLHNQTAYYCEGQKVISNLKQFPAYLFIAIEKTYPYEIGLYLADQEMLEYGLIENNKLLQLYSQCKTTNNWPSYNNDGVQMISLPQYGINKINQSI